jgi:hypothetical protein
MRSRNIVYSLTSATLYQLTLIISNFWVTRLMLVTFGSEINGLQVTIQQLINYINIVGAGIALVVIPLLYKPLADKNWNLVNRILKSTTSMYYQSGLLFLIALVVLSLVFPYSLDTNIDHLSISILIIVMAGGSIVEYFLNGKLRVLLLADQKSYIINCILIIALIFSTLIKLLLIKFSFNFTTILAVGTLTSIISYFLKKLYVGRLYKLLSNNEIPMDGLFANRWSVLHHQIAGLVVFNSPLIIISIYVGLIGASIFAIYNMIFSALIMIITMFSQSTIASFGNLIATEDIDKLKIAFKKFQVLFYSFGTWLYTVTFLLLDPFINLYTHGVKDVIYTDKLLGFMLTLVGILNMFRVPNNIIIEASGHYKQTQSRAMIEALINICTSLVLVQYLGIYGVLIGSICSYLYRCIDIIIYSSYKILRISLRQTIYIIGPNILISLSIILTLSNLGVNHIYSWSEWVLYATIVSIVSGTSILILNNLIFKNFIRDFISILKPIFITK